MLKAIEYARINRIPFLGICLGLQCAIIEIARNICNLKNANSIEFDPYTPHQVIHIMESQKNIKQMGGTMRLGAYWAKLAPGSQIATAYGEEVVSERHRHRYEFNPAYRSRFEESDVVLSGESPDGRLVEFIELDGHPFWIGTQAHPEFKSRPDRPAPLFREFIASAMARAEGRNPQLLHIDILESSAGELVVDSQTNSGSDVSRP